MKEASNTIVHFYRAAVMHADVWRRRLDATTNWAVGSTAGMVTFAFSSPELPHFVVLLAGMFTTFFLIMESRRYQAYDMWRRRVKSMDRWIIAPALSPATAPPDDEVERRLTTLAADLGTSVPRLPFMQAVGYRIRRNYGFLYLAALGSWLLKIGVHPTPAGDFGEYVRRAHIHAVPGSVVLGLTLVGALGLLYLALRARTERMEGWVELPSPLEHVEHALRGD